MVVIKDVKFGEKTFPIVFSSNALFKMEEKTGLSTERIGLLMASGRAGYQMMQIILWAALEAGRMKTKARRPMFDLEEVGDLLDEVGGSAVVWAQADDGMEAIETSSGDVEKKQVREAREMHPVAVVVMEAWQAAFPKQRPITEPQSPNELTPAES